MYFDRVGCDKWKTGCHHCPQLQSYPKSLFIDRSSANWERKRSLFTSVKNLTLVPVSNWLGDLVSQSYLGNYPIRVIHNGVDLNVFKPTTSGLKDKLGLENKFVVLGVANGFSNRKGLEDFVRMGMECPNDIQIIMIGTTPEERASLPKNIIAIDKTDDVNELVAYYSIADVYINPTYEDNFPTTNIEALACGTPVITYNTGGSPEAVDDRTGIVVEKGDVNGLMRSIELILKKDGPVTSAICRERAECEFNKNSCFLDYLHLYDEIKK